VVRRCWIQAEKWGRQFRKVHCDNVRCDVFRNLVVGCWLLVVGYWMLDFGYWQPAKVAIHARSTFRVMWICAKS
jgi:hypothetical protein